MAMLDVGVGYVNVELLAYLNRAQESGGVSGRDILNMTNKFSLSESTPGSETGGSISGWFSARFSATTSGIVASLADADVLGAAGDERNTVGDANCYVKAIYIENMDATNYVEVTLPSGGGTLPLANWIGTGSSIRIYPGSFFLHCSKPGSGGIQAVYSTADEIKITANTASCTVQLTVLYSNA